MKVLLVEPFLTGSHESWARGWIKKSQHEIHLLSLPGRHWKWRMHGGAISLAQEVLKLDFDPDLVLVSDMIDLAAFLAHSRKKLAGKPIVTYFHENQLSYPWSPTDPDVALKRDNHYSFINYSTALVSDKLFFNSAYHKSSFLKALPSFLEQFPDNNLSETVEEITNKSEVLHLGCDLDYFRKLQPAEMVEHNRAVILWNHRWEYDKNPEEFFQALFTLADRGIEFKLIVLGERFSNSPPVFEEARERLDSQIIHWGYLDSKEEYAKYLWESDIIPVTSRQDFFGTSLVEAMACDVVPLLPNRLAFPEHIPQQFHKTYFYEDQRDFVNRLQRLIFNVKIIRKQNMHQYVMHYDWNNIVEEYDRRLEEMTVV